MALAAVCSSKTLMVWGLPESLSWKSEALRLWMGLWARSVTATSRMTRLVRAWMVGVGWVVAAGAVGRAGLGEAGGVA